MTPGKAPASSKSAPSKTKAPAKRSTARKAAKKAPAKAAVPRRRRFGARGQRLWNAHHEEVEGERGLVLLDEACRIADRLDRLDALLKGEAETWFQFELDDRSQTYVLVVTGALIEARQQANVLRQLVSSLPLKGSGDGGDDDKGGWVDGL